VTRGQHRFETFTTSTKTLSRRKNQPALSRGGPVGDASPLLASIGAAYLASNYQHIMTGAFGERFRECASAADVPLGMFWRRPTGHGAFVGLLAAPRARSCFTGLAFPQRAAPFKKGGCRPPLEVSASEIGPELLDGIVALGPPASYSRSSSRSYRRIPQRRPI